MTKYYHIHRGIQKSNLENGFENNRGIFFFSKKDSFWYRLEINISKDYGGYIIYEICIPKNRFTTSFNPRSKKIVKITKKNIKEYKKLQDNRRRDHFMNENIIGFDLNTKFIEDRRWKYITPEGFIWEKPNDITIKKIKTVKL